MRLESVFFINQGHQITDEEIYQNIIKSGKIKILTAENEIKGRWDKTIVMNKDLPCITYPTKANSGVCYVQTEIFDANNTAVLIIKPEWKGKVNLNWLAYNLSKEFPKIATSKEGVNYLNKEIVKDIQMDFPSPENQKREFESISRLLELRKRLISILDRINEIKETELVIDYSKFQKKDIPVEQIFSCISGNSGLTEEYLYSVMLHKTKEHYKVLTGSLDVTTLQEAPLCASPKNPDKLIRVFSGEGIHIVRKGKAGYINFIPSGKYTLNDDAYVLVRNPISEVKLSLKWVVYTKRRLFYEYASTSDNGTWNMTSFFEQATLDIPSFEEQKAIEKVFDEMEVTEGKIKFFISRIDEILEKEIVT